jgi:hypothetical protein
MYESGALSFINPETNEVTSFYLRVDDEGGAVNAVPAEQKHADDQERADARQAAAEGTNADETDNDREAAEAS